MVRRTRAPKRPASSRLRPSAAKAGKASRVTRAARKKPANPGPKQPTPRSVEAQRDRLETSEVRFRALVDTAATPLLLLSPRLVVLELNPEAELLYGRKREELVGRHFLRFLDGNSAGGLTGEDFGDVLAGRPARGVEGRFRRASRDERVLLWNATRLMGATGRPVGVIVVAQDITDRQRAEEALREREARLTSIIATAPDAVITIDERGIIQSFSSAAEKLLGYAAGEVIGRNVNLLMAAPHHEAHDGYLKRYLNTGEKRIIGIGRTVEARRKDGTVFPMELAVGEARLGETRLFTGFIRDITARSRMEEQLRQAQKMEAIGQLTGGVAHDFNNLLTVISGNLELLEERIEDAGHLEILNEAQEAAELGGKLASRLLAFGRRQPLNPKPIDLSALVAGMTDLLRRSLGEMIRIETRLRPDLGVAMADPGQCENALLNLALNARDAMPDGGRVLIETERTEIEPDYAGSILELSPGHYVMLSVTDTGMGMAPDVRERAFEPFFTTKGPGLGSGLGLSMVYGFVKQSGGHVQLESQVQVGTTVRIFLPMADVQGRATGRRTGAAPSETSKGGEVVLVVEDDARVRRISVRRLKELGYRVVEVDGPAAALKMLESGKRVDLLFADVIMPGGMSGLDLAREVRRRWPEIKILFTSGYAEPATMQHGMVAGWLGKPYATRELAIKLRELLDE